MIATSFQKKKRIICMISLFLCLLTSFIGIVCYDRIIYELDPTPNLSAYAEQLCNAGSYTINQIDLNGISLVGVMDASHGYKVIGFIRSPISSRYKAEQIEYLTNEYNGKGLLCMCTPGIFTYDFHLYEATNENVNKLNMLNPYYFIFLADRYEGYKLGFAEYAAHNASWSIKAVQLIPYLVICVLSVLLWMVVCVVYLKVYNK